MQNMKEIFSAGRSTLVCGEQNRLPLDELAWTS